MGICGMEGSRREAIQSVVLDGKEEHGKRE
jgi:hypothetical protein